MEATTVKLERTSVRVLSLQDQIEFVLNELDNQIRFDFCRSKTIIQKRKFRKNFNKRKTGWRV